MINRLMAHRLTNSLRAGLTVTKFNFSFNKNYSNLVEPVKSGSKFRLAPTPQPIDTKKIPVKLAQVKRPSYKPRAKLCEEVTPNIWAYATAEQYDFDALTRYFGSLENSRYEMRKVGGAELSGSVLRLVDRGTESGWSVESLGKSQASSVKDEISVKRFSSCNEILLFREGVAVLWNVDQLERARLLDLLVRFQIGSFDRSQVQDEAEKLNFVLNDEVDATHFKQHEVLHVRNTAADKLDEETAFLEKYTISDAMARSVKLALKENVLSSFVETLDPILEDLKQGRIRVNKHDLLKKTGQLFSLRHDINLDSDLLDSLPDFYWDREKLQDLYTQASRLFCIEKRTRVINEKLNYCLQLGERLDGHLHATHSVRLERIIIFLIAIEVAFEFAPYFLDYMNKPTVVAD